MPGISFATTAAGTSAWQYAASAAIIRLVSSFMSASPEYLDSAEHCWRVRRDSEPKWISASPTAHAVNVERRDLPEDLTARQRASLTTTFGSAALLLPADGWQRWRAQSLQLLRGLRESWPETANPETGETGLHSVHDARALLDQALALAAWPPGVLILDRGNCSHAAVLRLTAQPTEKGALE